MVETPASGLTVLIAEDEALVRLCLAEMLEDAGYQVFDACDGQEALTILEVRGEVVRALVSDISMPNLDGLSLAKMVSGRWPHIGIILTSGYPPRDFKVEMPTGARFVQKPYRPANLIGEIDALVG